MDTHDARPLPQLCPEDTRLLTLYLAEVNTHLPAFATKSSLGIVAAIAFLARPDIALYVRHFHHLRESTQRMIALNFLREIVEVTEDPVEQRRAATALLRALAPSPPGGGPGRGGTTSRPPIPTPPPSPSPSGGGPGWGGPPHASSSLPSEGRAGEGLATTPRAQRPHERAFTAHPQMPPNDPNSNPAIPP